MVTRHAWVLIALLFAVDVRAAEAQCTVTVTPASVSVSSIGSTSSLSVVTGTFCPWTATSSVSWITVNSATGSGIGQVNYTVAANPTSASRTGTLIVAGQTITFTQGANSCTYSVSPTSVAVSSIGSTSALSVVTGSSCSWTATSSVSWITVTSATGVGLGQVNYTVAANTTAATRTGTLIVAGQTITFTQATNSCVYTVTPISATVPLTGGAITLTVTTGPSCSWTAASAFSWITVTAGATGSGIAPVSITVAAATTPRTATITVAGQTITIAQGQPLPAAPTNLRIVG